MKVFISHGHDHETRDAFREIVKRAGYQPVVLVDKSATGTVTVEKLEQQARGVDCALVILSRDDLTSDREKRARQNVIHELGYFHGLVTRQRVIIVAEKGVEWLSNLAGIEKITFERRQADKIRRQVISALRGIERETRLPQHVPPAMKWKIMAPDPTALVRVHRSISNSAVSSTVVHGANRAFLELFEYPGEVPDPDSDQPLTVQALIESLSSHGHMDGRRALIESQEAFFRSVLSTKPMVKATRALRLKRHPRHGNRDFYLYLVARGVVDKVESSKFISCLLVYQEDLAGLNLGRVSLESMRSQNVITVVLSKRKGRIPELPTIKVASSEAARFYGYAADRAEDLRGKTLGDLSGILRKYMEPRDYQLFIKDQERVARDYANFGQAWAKIPIRFNSRHRDDNFRNQTYYPIISHTINETNGGGAEDYIHVLYVNMDKLQAHLPRDPIRKAGSHRDDARSIRLELGNT